MHYVIDGHNLIGKLPDLSLSDPDDEVRLTLRLKSWIAESKSREVTLFFDGGVPGGHLNRLSGRQIKVIFAPAGQTADSLITRHLQTLKNPGNVTLITSDREIIRAAQVLRIRHLLSEEFVRRMGFAFQEEKGKEQSKKEITAVAPEKPDDPRLNPAEVQEWLDLFGPPPERPKKPRPAVLPPPPPPAARDQPPASKKPRPLRVAKYDEGGDGLENDEVDEWLRLFRGGKDKSG
jgi:uncharacterized protein